MWTRVAWSPRDNVSSLSLSPGSFFSWQPLGTPDELFWCCNMPTVAISFRGPLSSLCKASQPSGDKEGPLSLKEIVAGKKFLLPKRNNLSNTCSLTVPDGCTIFPRQQARDACVHTCSRSGGARCLWEAQDGPCLAVFGLAM